MDSPPSQSSSEHWHRAWNPLADPIIGLLISATIFVLLWGTVRSVGRRLMDGVEPKLLERAEHALEKHPVWTESAPYDCVGAATDSTATPS